MQLTLYADYALRVLIYTGVHSERRVTIAEVAKAFGISYHHLAKVVHQLATAGYIESVRGKRGGITLGQTPERINLGRVVHRMESCFFIAECFEFSNSPCRIMPACQLKKVLCEATSAFQDVLDRYTLADLLKSHISLSELLNTIGRSSVSGTGL
jgi:Rrf2 family nitric oxide-sensitive transcriptional repressor